MGPPPVGLLLAANKCEIPHMCNPPAPRATTAPCPGEGWRHRFDVARAAHCWAAVRRYNLWFEALYGRQIMKRSERRTYVTKSPAHTGGLAMRGGLRPLFRARGKTSAGTIRIAAGYDADGRYAGRRELSLRLHQRRLIDQNVLQIYFGKLTKPKRVIDLSLED